MFLRKLFHCVGEKIRLCPDRTSNIRTSFSIAIGSPPWLSSQKPMLVIFLFSEWAIRYDLLTTLHRYSGPFQKNPLHQHLICFTLQTVPKRGSTKRQAVMDLSYPPSFSVNSGISSFAYLDSPFKLRLLEIDRLREFILLKGRGFHVFKRDL